jgi:hypothetical protein
MIGNIRIAYPPEFAWRCHLVPGVVYHLEEGRQPNAFHRLMQRLCFGVRWERIEGEQP